MYKKSNINLNIETWQLLWKWKGPSSVFFIKKSKINDTYEMQKDLLQVIMSFLLYNEVYFPPIIEITNYEYFWKQMAAPIFMPKNDYI